MHMTKRHLNSLNCNQCLAESFCGTTKACCSLAHFDESTYSLDMQAFLIHANQPVTHFYFVKGGAFKKCMTTEDGREHIKAFFLPGEIIGLDAIGHPTHLFDVIALVDHSEVCKIEMDRLVSFMQKNPATQLALMKNVSTQFRHLYCIPRNAHAKEKTAAFLLNITMRLHILYPEENAPVILPMTRQDIGNYLGLTIETVSRIFTELKNDGILAAHGKEVAITDSKKLSKIAGF